MRILVHDYAGHPYAVQLSRALARKGHEVLHVYSASNPMPQGTLDRALDDATTFQIRSISLGEKIDKANLLKRRKQEIDHGLLVGKVIREFKPDVVLSGCAPLDTQNHIWQICKSVGCKPVFWLQDITGIATQAVLTKKLPIAGHAIGRHYIKLEERLLRQSSAVIAIAQDFLEILRVAGVRPERSFVIENWGPIDELPERPKSNSWSKRHGLEETFNLIYSGTLGMKHDPSLLLELAKSFRTERDVRVIVISEGIGRRWLEKEKKALQLDQLLLFDFQPFNEVPDVMGTSDVMTAILEPSAGVFSVPSKVLSYLCSSRALLLAIPNQNLAARIVEEAEAGLCSDPRDVQAFLANAQVLFQDKALRTRMGQQGRAFAERTFHIDGIAGKFLDVFETCLTRSA